MLVIVFYLKLLLSGFLICGSDLIVVLCDRGAKPRHTNDQLAALCCGQNSRHFTIRRCSSCLGTLCANCPRQTGLPPRSRFFSTLRSSDKCRRGLSFLSWKKAAAFSCHHTMPKQAGMSNSIKCTRLCQFSPGPA